MEIWWQSSRETNNHYIGHQMLETIQREFEKEKIAYSYMAIYRNSGTS